MRESDTQNQQRIKINTAIETQDRSQLDTPKPNENEDWHCHWKPMANETQDHHQKPNTRKDRKRDWESQNVERIKEDEIT